jgi:type VI protein secretion system component Hcp
MESTTQIFLLVQETEDEGSFVRGESMVGGYAKRVQIDSFSFGADAKVQAVHKSPQKGSSNLDFNPVQVTKVFDRASMRLAALLKDRKQLYEVRITVDQQLEDYEDKVGKAQNAIIVFHLMNARLVDLKLDVSEDKVSATIKETLSFTFKNFSVEYYYKGTKDNKKSDYRDTWVGFQTEYDVQE